jgi:hypothetical protein
MKLIERFTQIKRAQQICKTLGVRSAAGFLRNREFTLNEALQSLGFKVRAL